VVLSEVASDYRDELARTTDKIAARSRVEFVEQGGTIIPVSAAQRRAWAQRLPDLAGAWVESMNKKGLPGKQILDDYMKAMRDNQQPIMRDWDQTGLAQ